MSPKAETWSGIYHRPGMARAVSEWLGHSNDLMSSSGIFL